MAINSKSKGNRFEREVSEKLSLWLTNGEEKRACWRSDSSGASATNWAKKKQEARYVKANAGDIRQVAEKGIYPRLDSFFRDFVVELKHYKEIDFYPPFNGPLGKFLDACIAERKATGKKSLLILKANNRKILWCQEIDPDNYTSLVKEYFLIKHEDMTLSVSLFDDVINLKFDNGISGEGDSRNTEAADQKL